MNSADVRRKQKELLFPNVTTYYQDALVVDSAKGMFASRFRLGSIEAYEIGNFLAKLFCFHTLGEIGSNGREDVASVEGVADRL